MLFKVMEDLKKGFALSFILHLLAALLISFRLLPLGIDPEPLNRYEFIEVEILNQVVRSDAKEDLPKEKAYLGDKNRRAEEESIKRLDEKSLSSLGVDFLKPASSDHVKNVSSGAETELNTKEYVYWGFYERVRQKLEHIWVRYLRENVRRIRFSGKKLFSDFSYETEVVVVLDSKGVIQAIEVIHTSGVYKLDEAATRAFNRAGPFPNPPRGLIEEDGLIRVRWAFILKT